MLPPFAGSLPGGFYAGGPTASRVGPHIGQSSRRLCLAFLRPLLPAFVAWAGLGLTVGIHSVAVVSAQPPAQPHTDGAWVSPGVPHPGSDQIWWVPTFAQAQEVAAATGRLILVMGSVSDWRDGY